MIITFNFPCVSCRLGTSHRLSFNLVENVYSTPLTLIILMYDSHQFYVIWIFDIILFS